MMHASAIALDVLCGCLGAATAALHLVLLRHGISALTGGRTIWRTVAVSALRVPLTVIAFVWAALHGAAALCTLFAGFMVVFAVATSRARSAAP